MPIFSIIWVTLGNIRNSVTVPTKDAIPIAVREEFISSFISKKSIAGFTGISTDWENQRCFIQYSNRYTYASEIDEFYTQSLHFGITPYIGDYGDIHTWIMMKIDHTIKCVRKFGYHLGTILGTIWVPFDILGTIEVPSWVP